MKFLRFGEIPKSGKSINFFKMTLDQVDNFSDCLRMGYPEDAFELVPKEAYEPGLSVFKMDSEGLPVVDNMRLIYSLCARLDEPIYIVGGKKIGEGNDGEPLVNVENVEFVRIGRDQLVNVVLNTLKQGFAESTYNTSEDLGNNEINAFYTTGREEFCFNGWTFSDPVSVFDASTGIAGRR